MIGLTASSEMIVAVCSLLGLFLVTLVVLMRRRASPSMVDVDDFHSEKQSKSNSTKKIKQKKVKTTTNAASESSSNSTQTKVSSIKQSPVKNASKEKQTDEKKKPVQKKGSTSANASSQQVQQTAETVGDWSIAVSKKKQKTKKKDSSAENLKANVTSNGQFDNDPKTADSKEFGGKLPSDEATQSFVTQKHNKPMVDKKKSDDETGALLFEPHQVDTMREQTVAESSQQPPVELLSEAPLKSGEGDLAAVHSAEKSKKTSKKKKSKLTTEITRPSAVSDAQDDKKSANSSLMANLDPQTKNAKPLPDGASAGLASSEYVSKCEVAADDAATLPKDLSKAKKLSKNAHLLEEIFDAHSESNSPVAIGTSSKNKMSDKETSELVSSSVPDVSVTVSGSNLAENVASFPLKDVASSPGASTLPSQIVFDELGLKDEDLNSSQPALKKKKKARKDV